MAVKQVYIGTVGPLLIDEDDPLYDYARQVAVKEDLPAAVSFAISVVTEQDYGQDDAVGVADVAAREDHTHGTPPAPSLSDTVTSETSFGISPDAGEAADYARGDHTHGTPANPVSGITNNITVVTSVGPPVVTSILHFTDGLLTSVT